MAARAEGRKAIALRTERCVLLGQAAHPSRSVWARPGQVLPLTGLSQHREVIYLVTKNSTDAAIEKIKSGPHSLEQQL